MANQAGQGIKSAMNEHANLFMVVKGIVISYLITIPVFMVLAFILTNTDFPEKFLSPAVMIATVISVLVAGSTATQNVRSGGWLNGSLVGAAYMLILYLASSLVFRDFSINMSVITMFVIGILAGAIGGILGINVKKPGHTKHKR